MAPSRSLFFPTKQTNIDLSDPVASSAMGREIRGQRVVGSMHDAYFPASSYQCEFADVDFHQVTFDGKDFRDCVFRNVSFAGCRHLEASIIGCTFVNCSFDATTLKSLSIHDCYFYEVEIKRSEVLGSMVRHSRLDRCLLTDCLLENKIFDECLLFDTKITSSNIDFRVVVDNFGLTQKGVQLHLLRVDRSLQEGREVLIDTSAEAISKRFDSLSALEAFRLKYYFSGDLLFSGSAMDDLLDVNNWSGNISTPSSFIRLITNLTEFTLRVAYQQQCTAYFVCRLHYLMYHIFEAAEEKDITVLSQAAIGAHHRLGQLVGSYETIYYQLSSKHQESISFLTDGSDSEQVIEAALKGLFQYVGEFAFRVGPRNSPVLIEILSNVAPFIALFLLVRVNFSVQRVDVDAQAEHSQTSRELLALKTGRGRMSLTTSLAGDLLISLSLQIDSESVERLKKIFSQLVDDS